jgi:hypothetical protein
VLHITATKLKLEIYVVLFFALVFLPFLAIKGQKYTKKPYEGNKYLFICRRMQKDVTLHSKI